MMASTPDALKELLVDMGRFLAETLIGETLSSSAEKHRIGLLQRLQPHIQPYASDVASAPTTPPPYLDMNVHKGVREEYVDAEVNGDKVEEEYEEFPEPAPAPPIPAKVPLSTTPTYQNVGQSEDYVNLALPYSELRSMTNKCGPLWKKEKFIFLEQWRRCWAGVYGHVVLLYNSERDAKPVASFDIRGFEARPLATNNQKDPKKKDSTFEIICPGKKTYQFIARTAKDMSQWVVAIAMANSQPTPTVPHRSTDIGKRRLPSIPDNEGEVYDDVGSSGKFGDDSQENYEPVHSDEEEIYHDIADLYQRRSEVPFKSGTESKSPEEEPPIPPRRPVPPLPKDDSVDEDDVLYDDVGVLNGGGVYCNVPSESTKVKTPEPDQQEEENNEEEIYDDIGVIEQQPDTKLSTFRRESTGRIQNIIKKMEESLSNGNKPVVGYSPKSESIKRTESEELYEPIENGEVAKLTDVTQRGNLVR
ncbi:src kinase-associated phosphoprotein 2-A-like [Periplaneta americana]|uniref:src kinase-associated phosphoprotein 2-A-like n=1 Tax=Periplaneta americana TaxID=6978 RepID=UPI0037E74513